MTEDEKRRVVADLLVRAEAAERGASEMILARPINPGLTEHSAFRENAQCRITF
jgi:hypothetical protein